MNIRVENPPGYDAKTMAQKLIRGMYGLSMAEFVAKLEREAQEERKEARDYGV